MSKMKHLLRKLRIGGGGGGGPSVAAAAAVDDHPCPSLSPNPPTISSTSSSSPSSSISSKETSVATVADVASSDTAAGRGFSLFEEEYQVQLALALSASDPDGVEDLDSVQMKAAKRMSLVSTAAAEAGVGSSSGGGETAMDLLSLRYWSHNVVSYDEKLMDGFYDVYGVISNPNLQGKMPSLVDLQALPVSDNIEYEVVLVNHMVDYALQQLERRAAVIASECKVVEQGPISSGLVQKIADLVVDNMGGPVDDAEDMLRRWTFKSFELRASLNTIVLPLGLLEIGLSRHRALLFKVLADQVNLPCKLVKGSYYTGTDDGAVNFVKVDRDSEYMVDLMGAPGTLIPAEVPSCHVQNSGFCLTIDTIDQAVQELCLALDNVNFQLEKKSQSSDGNSSGNSLVSRMSCLQEEKLKAGQSGLSDDVSSKEKNQIVKYESKILIPPSDRTRIDASAIPEVISPAQQMKVHDVSKYVATAAKDPEFAQKLHAVLLESGASPPLDLFSDLNLSQNQPERKDIGNICMDGKEGQRDNHLPGVDAESSNSADYKRKQQCFAVVKSDMKGSHSDTFLSPVGACQPSPLVITNKASVAQADENSQIDSYAECTDLILGIAMTSRVPSQHQIHIPSAPYEADSSLEQSLNEIEAGGMQCSHAGANNAAYNVITQGNVLVRDHQQRAKDPQKFIGIGENDKHKLWCADNERIDSLLDGVTEWEIPWEDLQVGERIGLGSYGEVYRADWNGTEVAVKKFLDQGLSGDALEQFRCEVKMMSRLRHPNVILFMGAVTRPPNLSILTEFLPRGSLFRLLHRPNVKLDEKRRLKMALDVAKGMNYLHTSHPTIVHRDLKSPNLLVDKNWVVKVCDFGLSRLKHHTFLSSKSTAGTPEWMAPEVLRNEPSNEKCDIYSFGVILWELATMRVPWNGMNSMQVVGAVGFQNRRLDIPQEVDPMVAQIITECWDGDPSQRPSFAQLIPRLKQLQRLVATS